MNNHSIRVKPKKNKSKPRAAEITVLILVAWGGVALLLPFLIIRIRQSDYAMVVVDGLAILSLLLISGYMKIARNLYIPSVLLNVICIACVVTACYLTHLTSVIHWLYPAMMWAFYLSSSYPLIALGINTIAALVLAPLIIQLPLLDALHITVGIILTNVLAYIFATRAHLRQQHLMMQVDLDPLTGIGNRRAMYRHLQEAASSADKVSTQISVIILDLDHFKRINDTFGHAKGDDILKQFAEMLTQNTRKHDHCFRYGGEEFLVLAVDSDLDGAAILGENLRKATEIRFSSIGSIGYSITASLGVAQWQPGESSKAVLARADQALYQAKSQGRNTIGVSRP